MDAKEKGLVRESFYFAVSELSAASFEYLGMFEGGAIFTRGEDVVVLSATVKNAGFDAGEAIRKFAEKQALKEEKAREPKKAKATKPDKAKIENLLEDLVS